MTGNHTIHHCHPVVKILGKTSEQLDNAHHAVETFKAIAGTRAFREYDWLKDVAIANKSGNFRGMVVSARWKTLFDYSSEVGKVLENVGTFATFAANIAQMGHQFETIWTSRDPMAMKGLRFAVAAGTAAERTLAGRTVTGVHLIYKSLEGWCMIAGLAGGPLRSASDRCIDTLKNADALVHKTCSVLTDTNNQSKAIWWAIDMRFVRRVPNRANSFVQRG